ncbi:MAG: metallophosphoesterase [Bacteroidia bacterium]|nr:metallophosphoesterase [Bacteroidia bacterium]
MKRRKFITGVLGLGTAGILTGLYTWQIEPFWLEFVKISMRLKNLPNELIGKTLMQISDLHVGNKFRRSYLIESLKKAQEFNPDYVVYTGDYVSYESREQLDQLREVLKSVVKGKIGTVGILGNHDYAHNWSQPEVAQKITEIVTEAGIHVLRNDQVELKGLNLTGLDDYWGTNYYPKEIMSKINHDAANIVLCHNPDVMDEPIWNSYQSWVLSGHTHGGQCKPPFLIPPALPVKNKRYTCGQFDFADGRILYINRALGHLWQVRFNVRPEITIFKLEKA